MEPFGPLRRETEVAIAAVEVAMKTAHERVGASEQTMKGARDVVTATDLAIEDAVRAGLAETSGAPVIGEERGGAAEAGAYWIVDPICATSSSPRSGHILRRILPRRSHGTYLSEAAFSPDGRRVVFAERSDPTDDGVLYVSSADGTHAQRLTLGPGSASDPSFSPDGRTIVYVDSGEGNGSGEVWTLPLRRPAAARRVTREGDFEFPALIGD